MPRRLILAVEKHAREQEAGYAPFFASETPRAPAGHRGRKRSVDQMKRPLIHGSRFSNGGWMEKRRPQPGRVGITLRTAPPDHALFFGRIAEWPPCQVWQMKANPRSLSMTLVQSRRCIASAKEANRSKQRPTFEVASVRPPTRQATAAAATISAEVASHHSRAVAVVD